MTPGQNNLLAPTGRTRKITAQQRGEAALRGAVPALRILDDHKVDGKKAETGEAATVAGGLVTSR